MLSKIRNNLRAFSLPLWIVAASFIGTIFFVWGKGSFSGPSASEVATVNGEGISLTEFNREYQRVEELLRSQFGKNFRKFVKDREIKAIALNNLITRHLLLQLARKEGLKVSDWAVAKYIESVPLFQEKGKFSLKLYEEFLKANHLTPSIFEKTVREDLLIQKVLSVVNNAPSLTKFELTELYKKLFGKRKFKYKLFNVDELINKVSVSPAEVEEFYAKNKEMFKEEKGESAYVLKFKKDKRGEEEAEKAYKLAKEGKFQELLKLKPEVLEDKSLLSELKDKKFLFKTTDSEIELAFKASSFKYKPLSQVSSEIEKRLKEEKALQLAAKLAQSYKGELPKETQSLSIEDFVNTFKPLDLKKVEELFLKVKTGNRLVVPLLKGYGVFEPETSLEVKEIDKNKEEKLKKLVINAKRKSDYLNLVNLLRQRATVKVNPNYFRGS